VNYEYDDTIYTPSELMRKVAREGLMGACQIYNGAEGQVYGFLIVDMDCNQSQFDDRVCEMLARLWIESNRWRRQARNVLRYRPAKTRKAPPSNTGPNEAPTVEG
jgi:hypothetical protein